MVAIIMVLAGADGVKGKAYMSSVSANDGTSSINGKLDYAGVLTFIDNYISQSTRTILLRATIANAGLRLLPGQYVKARLHLDDVPGAFLVPQDTVGATVEQRIVTLGNTYDDNVVAGSGVRAGDCVITSQLQKLRPGMPLDPAEEHGVQL